MKNNRNKRRNDKLCKMNFINVKKFDIESSDSIKTLKINHLKKDHLKLEKSIANYNRNENKSKGKQL